MRMIWYRIEDVELNGGWAPVRPPRRLLLRAWWRLQWCVLAPLDVLRRAIRGDT